MRSVCSPLAFGPQGPPGAPGITRGFGTVDYADRDAVSLAPDGSVARGTVLPLPAGVWTRVVRDLAPAAANFNPPAGPWAGFPFWDGQRLRARARGDLMLFKFAYRIASSLRDAELRFAVRPGDDPAFDFGPQPIALSSDAGSTDGGSETFYTQARSRFVTMGASIYVLLSSGGSLLEFSPEITPLGYAA